MNAKETKVLVNRAFEQPYPARYGAPAGTDKMNVRLTVQEFAGREYQNESVWANGVMILAAQYPAGTEYAARRVAKWAP